MNNDPLLHSIEQVNQALLAMHKLLTEAGFSLQVPGALAPETLDPENAPPPKPSRRGAQKDAPEEKEDVPEPEPTPKKGSTKKTKPTAVAPPPVAPEADEKEPTTLKDVQVVVGQAFSRGEDALVRKFLKANGAANVSKLDPALWDDLIAALT